MSHCLSRGIYLSGGTRNKCIITHEINDYIDIVNVVDTKAE